MGNFFRILRKNRDWRERGKILRETEKRFLKESGMKKISVETASPISKKVMEKIEKIFGEKIFFRAKIRSDLHAGIRIEIDNEALIDATAKNRLKKLFSSG